MNPSDSTTNETGGPQPSAHASSPCSRPTHRPCAWCAADVPIVRRPGRPRLYCGHTCRQRAYEHRHGFTHRRSPRPLPGQPTAEANTAPTSHGYERGGSIAPFGQTHALRTSVLPEGRRRQTLCGLLALPIQGQHFHPNDRRACKTCRTITSNNPLAHPINASNELSAIRAVITDVNERRVPPSQAFDWIQANTPRAR
jgi:hypothetical protein